jgi:hypothetical protein
MNCDKGRDESRPYKRGASANDLDEDVLDLLLERNPRLIEECRQIRERMKQGAYLTHEQALTVLEEE